MKERKRERERERERESGLGREVRGPSPVHSPVLRSWSLFIILFRNAGQHKSLLFRDQPPPHPDRPAVHPHPGAGLSSPAVPLSLSILLFFPLAIRIVLRAHHYHRFLIQASYSRTRGPHYQHQEAGLPPIQISTLWTLPWPRPRRASPVTRGQSSEMLQGRGQVRS